MKRSALKASLCFGEWGILKEPTLGLAFGFPNLSDVESQSCFLRPLILLSFSPLLLLVPTLPLCHHRLWEWKTHSCQQLLLWLGGGGML